MKTKSTIGNYLYGCCCILIIVLNTRMQAQNVAIIPNTLYYEWSQDNFATVANTAYSPNPLLDLIDDYQTIYVCPVNTCGYGATSFVYVNPDYLCHNNGKDHRQNLSGAGEEKTEEPQVNVFPNPAKDALEISIPGYDGNANIKLFNVQGQLVQVLETKGEQTIKLEIPDVPEGLYFLHLELDEMNVIKKIQVIN